MTRNRENPHPAQKHQDKPQKLVHLQANGCDAANPQEHDDTLG
jgi:hypothetical protein